MMDQRCLKSIQNVLLVTGLDTVATAGLDNLTIKNILVRLSCVETGSAWRSIYFNLRVF